MDGRDKPGHDEPGHDETGNESGRLLDAIEAGALLDRLGIARAPAVALDADMTRAPDLPFPYPVAVKVLAAAVVHKTDLGGVALDIGDGDALVAAVGRMRESIARRQPDARIDRVLVQPMVSGLGEVLIGYRVDADAGPLIMVAAGGVLTEIYRDRTLRLAPVDLAEARAMMREVQALKALAKYRGRPAGDLDALARATVALSGLAGDASVAEAEINPLIVNVQGVVAVDAFVRLA